MAKAQQVKIKIDPSLNPRQRVALAGEVIDFIINRTIAEGKDKDNKKFPKYEKDYADRKGVGVNDVDLLLSSEMLEKLQLIRQKKGELTIGYERGDDINGKVEGNRTGSYGQPSPNRGKARDFLGITNKDLHIIQKQFREAKKITKDDIKRAEQIASSIIESVKFDT